MLDWDRAFVNTNVNEKVFILNKIILTILSLLTKPPSTKKNKISHPREKQCL